MNEDEADEIPDFLKRLLNTPPSKVPTPDELFRAAGAPHDADTRFLRYLAHYPEYVEYIEVAERLFNGLSASDRPGEWKPEPKPLIERIREELKRREQRGEKGGELQP